MNRKLLIAAFALALSAAVFAQTEADFTVGLTADGEGVVIKKYKGKETQVRIPVTIQGMPVREIGDKTFTGRETTVITSLVIPEGVVVIGGELFNSPWDTNIQKKLSSVRISSTVTSIGAHAFYGCPELTSITIPNSVTRIGESAFENCSKLESITIPNSVTYIGNRAFAESGLKSFTWPASVTKIERGDTLQYGMFTRCKNLQTVIIQEGVTEIGWYAFRGCTALTSVTLPSTIERIGDSAFLNCSALTTIVIPDTVESIEFNNSEYDGSSFQGCSKLTLVSQAALKRRGYTGIF